MPSKTHINGKPIFGPPRPPRQNYLLSIHLEPKEIANPAVKRTLSCPATATFDELHQAIQVAFGWASTHTFDFKVKDPNAPRVEDEDDSESMLNTIRTLESGMQTTTPRRNLLRIIEKGEGGVDTNGVAGFRVDSSFGNLRRHAQTPEKTSKELKLYEVLDDANYRDCPLEYEYDFGDAWTHEIEVIGREEPTEIFTCSAGEGHGVAEDVASTPGWKKLKEAYRATNPTKDQKENMKWFETRASNKDPKGLRNGRERIWGKDRVNRLLAQL
ncbi:MAG: hypothetical protein M1812_002392 [Candelaria pacifica]|nr:MAG: hypothetical protein M1812_002392 [Candelaria pacifica]